MYSSNSHLLINFNVINSMADVDADADAARLWREIS